jgi:hypothetical protein
MKKLDPKQLFIISAISRKDIAEMLNDSAFRSGRVDVDRFTRHDTRLTDAVCREVADLIYDAECQADDRTLDRLSEANLAAADTFLGGLKADMRKRPKPAPRKRTRK